MKNKTIILGKPGSGKSYTAVEKALKNKGTTLIVNACCGKSYYERDFPQLRAYEEKESNVSFSIKNNEKYYIPHANESTVGFANALIFGCGYGKLQDDKHATVLFDDGSWLYQKDKILTFWQLTHVKCGIVIVCNQLSDVFGLCSDRDLSKDMLGDISKYWNILQCNMPKEKPRQIRYHR